MKVCADCKDSLPLSAFGPRKDAPDGLRTRCRACLTDYKRQYRARLAYAEANRGDPLNAAFMGWRSAQPVAYLGPRL